MKDLYWILTLILLIIIVDWLFFFTDLLIPYRMRYGILFFISQSVLIFLLISNIIYKRFFDYNSPKIKIVFFFGVTLLISMFIANRLLELNKFYNYSKIPHKGYSLNLFKTDSLLSHSGIPNSVGYYKYSIGDSVFGTTEVRFDSLGFRTVADNKVSNYDTLNLFLGCSFTFGDFLIAEDGFPYKTSLLLNHNFINAGGPGYGLGQMKQLADTLLLEYEFNYVFIQLTRWLADRAMSVNSPTHYGYLPSPYFSNKGTDFSLNYPAYKPKIYNIKDWSIDEKTYLEKLKFFFDDGFKIEILDYLSYRFSRIKMILGILPASTKNKLELEKYFYSYLIDRVKEHEATPIILKIWYPDDDCSDLLTYIDGKAKIVDLDLALDLTVQSTGQDFKSLFSIYHLHNGVKLYYDNHPNTYANELFSRHILINLKTE